MQNHVQDAHFTAEIRNLKPAGFYPVLFSATWTIVWQGENTHWSWKYFLHRAPVHMNLVQIQIPGIQTAELYKDN